MVPGQEKHQRGDQPEAHAVVLPPDGSLMLEGHPDNVSEDKGEVSSCRSLPDSVYSSTSSSEGEVGNDSISSSSGSSTSNSGCNSTSSSSEEEVGNGCTTSSSPTVDRAYTAPQLLEVLPPIFKYIQDIEMAQKLQEDIFLLTSLESIRGLDKQKEPILGPEDSKPIGTSQHYQVGWEEDAAHVTSVISINNDAEEEPPAKRSRDSSDEEEVPAMKPSWEEVLQSIGTRLAWRCGKEWEDEPILPTPVFIAYQKTDHEDPVLLSPVFSPSRGMVHEDPFLSSPFFSPSRGMVRDDPFLSSVVFSLSPLTYWEDPILSPCVFSPSLEISWDDPILSFPVLSPLPSIQRKDSTLSSSAFCFWMDSEEDIEEESIPSTSDGTRESFRQLWFRPHYHLSSDSD
ncbi:uncharacterized protein LOC107838097 isoform X2 [Poecilia formosa]|uniref:uncharacterized protein LOC107838097 isoform X2 n=1 Tax=Poecilia formosa TaxID=48698 RepID=UPI0007B95E42|nr:PREDICTED: uncharacterized protein LOC107838097 isoform X2 [Poecilia formosa]